MNKFLFISLLFISTAVVAQPSVYSTANAHSHNDYEQPAPLTTAYNEMFGSIEADIYWHNGELLVAHTPKELALHRTLEELYLKPLNGFVEKNKGNIYADKLRRLQFMIDIKTNADTTLGKLVELLQKYPALTKCTTLTIAISGSRPEVTKYASYPSFIWFDGELQKEYPADALARIVMLSSDLKKYTMWSGRDALPAAQARVMEQAIKRAHALGKTVRFWGAPDNEIAWQQLIKLQVDYINTDSIKALSDYLKRINAH